MDDRYDIIERVPITDVTAALRCEADRAESEGFKLVAERQRNLADRIEAATQAIANVIDTDEFYPSMDIVIRARSKRQRRS